MKHRLVPVAAAIMLAVSPHPVAAADVEVDLELVLAVDVSRSMDTSEQQLQRDGYVAAFHHPDVIQAIQSGALGRIAVTYFEWAGPGSQTEIAPWTLISNAADADAFTRKLSVGAVNRLFGTSISSSLSFGAELFDDNGFTGERRAIDISGDGPNNSGRPVEPARDAVVSRGITINGLPIVIRPSYMTSAFGIPNLDAYYKDCVIGGPGAFTIAVTDPANFEVAIRRKLVTEIAGTEERARVIAVADTVPAKKADCMVGEKTRPSFFDMQR